jgi:hypothetical protein
MESDGCPHVGQLDAVSPDFDDMKPLGSKAGRKNTQLTVTEKAS